MAQKTKEAKITKTAVVLIGEAIDHSSYERSKLYDPEFSTEFREKIK